MKDDYTYAVARLRAIEASMPDRAWFQRLARTPESGLLAALREYYPAFEGVDSIADFERGIEGEKRALLDLISALVPDRRADELLRSGYDFDNLIHAWKAWKLGREPALVPFGLVDPDLMAGVVRGEGRGDLPAHLKSLLDHFDSLGGDDALVEAELTGEQAKWDYLGSVAPGEQARGYVRARIDLANIKNSIRLERVALRRTDRESMWLSGGGIEPRRWQDLVKEPEEELFRFLENSAYRNLIRLGLDREMPLWRLEPLLRTQLFDILEESRYRFFDISPVLYHMEIRERDERLLRAIIVSRQNELPEDMILEKVDALRPS